MNEFVIAGLLILGSMVACATIGICYCVIDNYQESIWEDFKDYWKWHFLENTYRKIDK